MEFQFQCQLLSRFVITSTITMNIGTKHQIQLKSIRYPCPLCEKTLSRAYRPLVRPKLRLFGEAATTPKTCMSSLPRAATTEPKTCCCFYCVRVHAAMDDTLG